MNEFAAAYERGRWGETFARVFLESCGLACRASRYRSPDGEIDLIMSGPRLLVFVEVKTRGRRSLARPEAAVDGAKLGRLRRAARHWLWHHPPGRDIVYRFDVIAVEHRGGGRGLVLRHLAGVR
jgi:putative endonuclease